jgi:tetratricopeptide (TPR) repeat protein
MKKTCPAALLAFMLLFVLVSAANAQTPQQTLNQHLSDLQKNPNDYALREKIIRHVQTMKQKPAIPSEVIKHEGAAEYAFKNAKNESDYLDSAKEYEKALLIAPWLAIDYFNCGVAYEKAGQFKKAIAQFNLYLIAAPDAQDANAVLKRIGGLEYAAGKAGREPAAAPKKQNEYEDWLKKIDGRRYRDTRGGVPAVLEVRGNTLLTIGPGSDGRMTVLAGPWEIKGRIASTPRVMQKEPFLPVQTTFIISENGDRIIEHRDFSDGDTREYVWVWQR